MNDAGAKVVTIVLVICSVHILVATLLLFITVESRFLAQPLLFRTSR